MKKNVKESLFNYEKGRFKTLLIMKMILLLSFSFLFVVQADVLPQGKKISIEATNSTVRDVLHEVEEKSDYRFFYNDKLTDLNKLVNFKVKNMYEFDALRSLFKELSLTFQVLDNKLVLIIPKGKLQGITIKGKITDTGGNPLPGVNIVEKGTTNGAVTNLDGEYSISVGSPDAILSFSYVGFLTEEVEVTGKTMIDLTMVEDIQSLEEVIVIGYGTMKKSDLTGAVLRVDMDRKDMAANVELSQVLQGYLPGVNASSAGKAGENGLIGIRGQTSLSASDEPLIVLDGIIYNGSLSNINVSDIETVDILKDATAAAVYGSRSANGVIILTTKKGKSEKPLFNFNAYYGFQNISTTKRTNVMNAEEYAIRLVDYYYQQDVYTWYQTMPTDASGRPVRPDITNSQAVASRLRSLEEQENYLAGNEIDWVDEVTQTAPIQNYNLSVSGKTDKSSYYLSASYMDQEGVLVNDNFKRQTLRANFDSKLTNWLTFGLNSSYSHLDYSGLEASMQDALVASPLANMYNPLGNYPTTLAIEYYQTHPLGRTTVKNENVSDNIFIVLNGKIEIPKIKGLTFDINYSRDYIFMKNNTFYPLTVTTGADNNGYATKEPEEERGWLINNILSYSRVFNDKHKVNATLLYSRENRIGENSSLSASNFDNTNLGYNSMELGEVQNIYTAAWEENSISYMARFNYTFNNRYLFTATIRRDGFSGFGPNKKFASFPSISGGWVISEESFMSGLGWLDFLKLRLSYGLNGNQGIGRYSSLVTMESTSYVYGGQTAIGLFPGNLGNSDLGWESTASINVGLDYTILGQRISGQLELYEALTSDVLVERAVPTTTGYSTVWSNIGEIKNRGVEVGITSHNINSPLFKWDSRITFSLNRDEITKLYEDVTEDIGNEWFVGEPISAHYDYTIEGVWQEKDLFSGNIHNGFYPGMFRFKDFNNDNEIDADNDRTVIGYRTPNYRFGINNSFTYKGFTLSCFINSIQGGNGYYIDDNYETVVAGGTDYAYRTNRNAIRPYWRPDNPVNNAPAMYYGSLITHGVYEDRSFVRLQDVSLSYNFENGIADKLGLQSLQIYISGKNLYTWTKWSGWDPEIIEDGDETTYDDIPMMMSIIGGVKVSF